jgi:hypothetical protein
MNKRFCWRKMGLVGAVLLGLSAASTSVSEAGQSDAKRAVINERPVAEQGEVKGSSIGDEKISRLRDVVLLTREYAPVSYKAPKLVEKAEVPNSSFTREWYRAEWRAQDPFYLYVIRPKRVSKPPVILYLPSFPDDTELFTNNKWCELAVRGGYAIVGFVGNVTGHRTRYRLLKEWFVSEMPEALTSTTHDVQLILDYLAARGDFDMERVGMYGAGSGASIAILASVVDTRIKVLDLLAPWGDWKDWLSGSKVVPDEERAGYLKPEFLEKVEPLDPVRWLPRIHANSLRIEDIRGNKAMPDKAQEKLEAAAPDFAVIDEYGNGRAFLAAQQPPSVVEWAKAKLAPDANAQVALGKSQRIHFIPSLDPPPSPVEGLIPSTTPAKTSQAGQEKRTEKQNPR